MDPKRNWGYSFCNYDFLNIREGEGTDYEKIGEIHLGDFVITGDNDTDWDQVYYKDSENNLKSGYAYEYYLTDKSPINKGTITIEEIEKKLSSREKVVGIDFNPDEITPDKLREILGNKKLIPNTLTKYGTEYDTTDLAGQVDFVILKIGARGYGSKGTMLDYTDKAVELARVCEEAGVPYGAYFYSTAINNDEVKEEVKEVKEFVDRVKDEGIATHFVLPIFCDTEDEGGKSRIIKYANPDQMSKTVAY